MASGGPGVAPDPAEDQTPVAQTHLTPTDLPDSPGPQAGLPGDCDGVRDSLDPPGESAEGGGGSAAKVCQFFRMKKCRFGEKCRLLHSDPSADDSGAVSPDTDDKQDEERTEKKKKKGSGSKTPKPKYHERREVNKKPRMRTADEVISRIRWDPSVEGSEFVVGYVDRFLGVVERPFCDFNWDADLCDCDYSAELALPQHRIQYFTHRGHRVWDRHTRTDRVFGSTGQSLAPPFGREEQPTGDPEQEQDHVETAEEPPPAVSQQEDGEAEEKQTEKTHLEEEKQMDVRTPESCQQQQKSEGSCDVEEAVTRREASTDEGSSPQKNDDAAKDVSEEEPSAQWEESWEANNNSESHLEALHISPSPPRGQREERRGARPPKKRPTHFIGFRANTPAILSAFQQLQKEVTALLPSSAPHWHAASTLHVTMCLLVLPGPAQVEAAAEVLRRFAEFDRNPPVAVGFPVKLKHFNGRVLYLGPQPQLALQQLNAGLQEAFREEGLLHRDSFSPRYHLTLAKVKDRQGERVFDGVGDLRVGKGLSFGRLPVNTLHLCVVDGGQTDGFYQIVSSVTLR